MNELNVWRQRIRAARTERDPHAKIWRKIMQHKAGRNFREGYQTDGRVQPVNLVNNFSRVVLPHLLPRDRPIECLVSPKRPGPDYAQSAEEMTDRVNAVARQIRLVDQARRAIGQSFFACGILKVGFEVRTGRVVEVPSGEQPDQAVTVDVDRERVEGQEYLDADLPYVCAVSPMRLYPEDGSTNLDDGRWLVHEVYRTVEGLKADPRFAKVADSLRATHQIQPRPFADGEDKGQDRESDPLLGYLQLFEAYDRDRRRILWFGGEGCGCEDILAEGEWPAGIESFPFVRIAYEEIEDFWWPNSPLGVVFDLATSVDEFYAHMVESAAKAKTLILYDPDFTKSDDVAGLANARDMSIVPVRGLTQHVEVVTLGGLHGDHWRIFESAKALADELSGIGEFQRGVGPSSPKPTATEVEAVMAMSGIRLDDMKAEVNLALTRALEMVGALLIEHADMLQDVALPVGDPREGRFVDLGPGVVGEYLDYAYELGVSSTERTTAAIRQKRVQDLIGQSMDPNLAAKLQTEGKAFLTAPLLKRQLQSLGETNAEEYLVDLPPSNQAGEQQAAAEEDAHMVQTGQPVPVSPNQDHQAHLQVHQSDYEQSGHQAIAEHMALHEQYLQQQQQQGQQSAGGGGGGPPAGGSPAAGVGREAPQAAAMAM